MGRCLAAYLIGTGTSTVTPWQTTNRPVGTDHLVDQIAWPGTCVRLPGPFDTMFDSMTGMRYTDTNIISFQVPMTQALGKGRSDNGQDTDHYDVGSHSVRGRYTGQRRGKITVGLQIHPLTTLPLLPVSLSQSQAHTIIAHAHNASIAGQMMLRSLPMRRAAWLWTAWLQV